MNVESETVNQLPRIGSSAPDFTAQTTHGQLSLSDFKGKWFVLFSHPADFTPVCTTEFVAFQHIYPQLKEEGVELLGLSVDSVSSHLAWIRNIEQNFNLSIEFPVIADLDRKVATSYGMIMPDESQTETSRAVFVIDDNQKVRSIIYYPLTTGRNMDEIVRLVKALKTTDKHKTPTPANWNPGDSVLLSPPKTHDDMKVREQQQDLECIDWYLCKKRLP
ncbi:peroxiredoxin [Falsibacillus albus]|uniref:Peroxiredoxin n=1 Tax=Falsibacillus albus TaxID=2478915 RepID=A0A3L7JTY3_9BACI|nr:peroxiredoxin [Falsibacillus albus]RLQ93745.1 peroxiredoxin [Falsibacillus albus]